jgi:hypothetical protein
LVEFSTDFSIYYLCSRKWKELADNQFAGTTWAITNRGIFDIGNPLLCRLQEIAEEIMKIDMAL